MMKQRSLFTLAYSIFLASAFAAGCDNEPDVVPGGDGDGDGDGDVGDGDGDGECDEPQVECAGECVSTDSDPEHCGDCETACATGEGCNDGECVAAGCPTGEISCDDTCVDPQTEEGFCGNCETACATDETCEAGVCEPVGPCEDGELECSGNCINPQTDPDFCGVTSCEDMGAGGAPATGACTADEVCSSGVCADDCEVDKVACNRSCIDPLTDNDYCGATTCADAGTSGEACADGYSCVTGECELDCPTGQIDCGGVCTDPLVSNEFCGATTCADDATDGEACEVGDICVSGACELDCPDGQIDCEGTCTDPLVSNEFCGATTCADAGTSGEACEVGELCEAGACELDCPTGQIVCGDACVDPLVDETYCGATDCSELSTSGTVCDADFLCIAGTCQDLEFSWSDAELVAGSTDARSAVASATDAAGNVWVAYERTTPDAMTVLRKFDPLTRTWDAAIHVLDLGVAGTPVLSVAPNGAAVVANEKLISVGVNSVNASIYSVVDDAWSAPFRVDDPLVAEIKRHSAVGINDTGDVTVAWNHGTATNGVPSQLEVRQFLDGVWQDTTTIAGFPGDGLGSLYSRIQTSSNGDMAHVWMESRTANPGEGYDAFGSVWDTSARMWSTPTALKSAAAAVSFAGAGTVDVSLDANGNAYAVWGESGDLVNNDLFVSKFNSLTKVWSVGVSVESVAGAARDPKIFTEASGRSHVGFYVGSTGNYTVHALDIVLSPTFVVTETQLDTISESVTFNVAAQIVRDAAGHLHAVWRRGSAGSPLSYSMNAGPGWIIASPFVLNGPATGGFPRLVAGASGEVYMSFVTTNGLAFARYD